MEKLKLSCALGTNPRTQAILDGTAAPEGIDLTVTPLQASEMFYRQLKFAEFDVSEMSCSSLTIATSQAPTQWVALPVFTTRRFFHTGVLIRTDRGIERPADLAGKRIGVPEFQQTAAVWTRAVLRSEFGFDARTAHWHMERGPEISHGAQTGFGPPPGIDLQYIPPEKNLGQMLVDGELDAVSGWIPQQNLVDRSTIDPRTDPKVRSLFDPAAEAKRYYTKTKIFPISHCVVIRRSIVEQHPWVVKNVFAMFEAVRAASVPKLTGDVTPFYATGLLDPKLGDVLKTDLMPYGIKRGGPVLELITAAVLEDGLTKRRVGLDEIFAPEMMNV